MNLESYEHFVEEIITLYEDLEDETEILSEDDEFKLLISILRLEKRMSNLREKFNFPDLDFSLFSKNVSTTLFITSKNEYFRPIDYQYSFLLFLFLESIELENLEPNEIIDLYFDVVKEQLKYPDITKTKTGAVRCKTNIRFAILYLRDMGLINYYDRDAKRSWMPSLLGFLVCSYICLKKLYKTSEPISKYKIEILKENKNILIHHKLKIAIKMLSDPNELNNLLSSSKINSLNLPGLEKATDLIIKYNDFIENRFKKVENKRISRESFIIDLKKYTRQIEKENDLREFKKDLSLNFNAEINFNKLMKIYLEDLNK